MSWQDIVLTIGQICFILALLPSVFGKDKPALATSLMTAGVLVAFCIVNVSLELYFAAITVAFTSLTWFVLAFQVILRRHPQMKR
jgi:hypothetical protein